MDEQWRSSDFRRRAVEVQGAALEGVKGQPARIEVVLMVNGQAVVRMQAREPGLVAVVSKADTDSIFVEVVEPSQGRYRDAQDMPGSGRGEGPIESWHAKLLGIIE